METQHKKLGYCPLKNPVASHPMELTEEQLELVSGGDTGECQAPLPAQPGLQPGPQPGW